MPASARHVPFPTHELPHIKSHRRNEDEGSAGNGVASDFGPGWNHSHNARLAVHSDSSTGFGRTTPVGAAAVIVAHHAIRDMMHNNQYYVYAAGMLLYEETDGATKTYHYDYRGSTVAITDDIQLIVDRILYGPYGETVARQGNTDTPFLLHGAYGVETHVNGLVCMRARYYSPETRRFVNADPMGFEAGTNWYAFVSGNPVSNGDPLDLARYEYDGQGLHLHDRVQGRKLTYTVTPQVDGGTLLAMKKGHESEFSALKADLHYRNVLLDKAEFRKMRDVVSAQWDNACKGGQAGVGDVGRNLRRARGIFTAVGFLGAALALHPDDATAHDLFRALNRVKASIKNHESVDNNDALSITLSLQTLYGNDILPMRFWSQLQDTGTCK